MRDELMISVVLTTHNRPELLLESVGSVVSQTSSNWELIVVDDGSVVPVTMESINKSGSVNPIRILRHEVARGLSAARNTGAEVAIGDLVTFLDDDDLLASDAVQRISDVFRRRDEIDCLFLNIQHFGPLADGTRQNQDASLARTIAALGASANTGFWLIPDSQALFVALLHRLPMAFQRPVVRRQSLRSKVGQYTGEKFGDLEWNYRAALRCRCAILFDKVSLFRCEGQSYFSNVDAKSKMLDAVIKIRNSLLSLPEVLATPGLYRAVRKSLSTAYFDKAYLASRSDVPFPWRDFARSLRSGIGWRHLSLLARAPQRVIIRRIAPK